MRYGWLILIIIFLSGCTDMKPIAFDFKTLQRNDKPNSYLICPPHFCTTKVDAVSPVYQVDLKTLETAWQTLIATQPRIEVTAANPANHTYQYVQRSLILRFPDYIDVQFIPLNNHQSTLAIYSHAVYGYYDFHVNEKRVTTWLAELNQLLAT